MKLDETDNYWQVPEYPALSGDLLCLSVGCSEDSKRSCNYVFMFATDLWSSLRFIREDAMHLSTVLELLLVDSKAFRLRQLQPN